MVMETTILKKMVTLMMMERMKERKTAKQTKRMK